MLKLLPALDCAQDEWSQMHLGQPWNTVTDPHFSPAVVRLAWRPDALELRADLTDRDIQTKATADNQRMWELGDVFEAFIMMEGESGYVELHVTPNNMRMHLDLPGIFGRISPDSEPLPFEEMLISPVGFTSTTTLTAHGWSISATIPAEVLHKASFSCGDQLRVSFCRYDTSTDAPVVLSTTSSHPVINFHRPQEWTRLVLG